MNKLKLAAYAIWFAGLSVAVWLFVNEGSDRILSALEMAGWGLLIVAAGHGLAMWVGVYAWRLLVYEPSGLPLFPFFKIRWISEGMRNLLPITTVGGEFLRAWLAHRTLSISGSLAAASVLGDLTISVISQIAFTLLGVVLLVSIHGGSPLASVALGGCLMLTVLIGVFAYLQRTGMFHFSSRMVASVLRQGHWESLVDSGQLLDERLRAIYHRKRQFIGGIFLHLIGWILGALEIWLGMYFLGHPVSPTDAVMVESLIQGVRSAAFMVPAAMGVQEGGMIVIGGFIGITPEIALALSMVKRVRELLWGVSGILLWQADAIKQFLAKKRRQMAWPSRLATAKQTAGDDTDTPDG